MRRGIVLLAALVVAGCDIPTEAPRWEQEWQVPVPVDSLQVSVAELLPPTVTVSEDGSAFLATVPGITARFALASMCGACAGVSGWAPVKPAFEDTLTTTSPLPADLVAASLTGGDVTLRVSHGFDFDPLRPASDPAAERGFMVVVVRSAGGVVARDSISGDDTAFPAGVTLTPTLAVAPIDVAGELAIEIRIHSPTGDGATLSATDELVVTLEPTTVSISEATVALADQAVGPEARAVDLPVDSALVERVRSGALLVAVENPFDVAGQLDLAFQLPGRAIRKSVPLEAGTYQERVGFTGQEIRDILGEEDVQVLVEGAVRSADGTVTVRPGQEMAFRLEFEVVILVGSAEEGI